MPSAALEFKRGDTWRLIFQYRDSGGDPIDLTGCVAWTQVRERRSKGLALTGRIDTGEIELVPAEGRINVRFESDATRDVAPGQYEVDMELTYPDGTVESTQTFLVRVIKDVTRDAG